jgi:hypothetical protein
VVFVGDDAGNNRRDVTVVDGRGLGWGIAAVLTTLGLILMQLDVRVPDAEVVKAVAEGSMVHGMSSHSPWMVPVFLGATVPVLWWRRSVIAVTGTVIVVMALHDVLFGWVTRCGAGLPVAFVLAFLGALAYERTKA